MDCSSTVLVAGRAGGLGKRDQHLVGGDLVGLVADRREDVLDQLVGRGQVGEPGDGRDGAGAGFLHDRGLGAVLGEQVVETRRMLRRAVHILLHPGVQVGIRLHPGQLVLDRADRLRLDRVLVLEAGEIGLGRRIGLAHVILSVIGGEQRRKPTQRSATMTSGKIALADDRTGPKCAGRSMTRRSCSGGRTSSSPIAQRPP